MSATIERVRKKLIATGQTQEQIEDGSGVSQPTVWRILKGIGGARVSTVEALEAYADRVLKKRGKKAAQ